MKPRSTSVVWALSGALVVVSAASAQDKAASVRRGPLNLGDSQADLLYTPVTPCRIMDTRLAGGPIAGGTTRDLQVTGADLSSQGGSAAGCGIPAGAATAAVINFVAVNPAGPGDLRITPFGTPMPTASILNYAAVTGLNIANGPTVAICNPAVATCTSDFTIQADGGATQVVADVQGYFRKLRVDQLPVPSNPNQVAILRSYAANQTVDFTGFNAPWGLAFDGASIWVTGGGGSDVTKLRASDGTNLGTFPVGSGPRGVAFDGANIWVANQLRQQRDEAAGERRGQPRHLPRGHQPRRRRLRRRQHLGDEQRQRQRDEAAGERRGQPRHLPRRRGPLRRGLRRRQHLGGEHQQQQRDEAAGERREPTSAPSPRAPTPLVSPSTAPTSGWRASGTAA